jgi:hypothetical protein
MFVPVKSFQLSLMFADKARSLPQSGVHKGQRPEVRAYAGKACCGQILYLITKFVNYDPKKLYNIAPRGQCYKTFYDCNLRVFIIS